MSFARPELLLWLLLAPAMLAAAALAIARSRAILRRFADRAMLARIAPGISTARSAARATLIVAAVSAIIAALARPHWGTEQQTIARAPRDVAFLIDVSRSMLAEDLAPNRLERAKLWVLDTLNARATDRVAIVAFAGGTNIAAPLTLDHAFARLALQQLSTDSVSLGGTNIGDAIRRTVREVFSLTDQPSAAASTTTQPRLRDIILITDGEDHGSLPIDAAAAAGQLGIRIIAIGIGSSQGVNIPLPDQPGRRALLEHEGQPVITRLDMPALRAIAQATPGGQAIEVETGDIDLAGVYQSLVRADINNQTDTQQAAERPAERFQWFLIPAIALILIERLIPNPRTLPPNPPTPKRP